MQAAEVGIRLQTWLLKLIAPPVPLPMTTVYDGKSKLSMLFGPAFLRDVRGLAVLDYGCGAGSEVIEMAKAGAARVVGVDRQERLLEIGRERAAREGVAAVCHFAAAAPDEEVDLVVSLDSFEHFAAPETELRRMYELLKPGGHLVASWGPPWYHPYGSHLLELPPWSHILFCEAAIMRWRALMRNDGATRYSELAEGLNQMSISRFERIVRGSRFRVEYLKAVPIRKLRYLHNRFTREFTSSIVVCRLRKPTVDQLQSVTAEQRKETVAVIQGVDAGDCASKVVSPGIDEGRKLRNR